jgi:hypothetical protein
VVDFCDVDSAKWTQYAADRRWPMSWLYRREGERLLDFERAPRRPSMPACSSPRPRPRCSGAPRPSSASRVGVMQNGVDADFFSPANAGESPYPARRAGDRVQRRDGLLAQHRRGQLVRHRAAAAHPPRRARGALLDRRHEPGARGAGAGGRGVVVTGTVPDVRPWVAHADRRGAAAHRARHPEQGAGGDGDGAAGRRLGLAAREFVSQRCRWDRCFEPLDRSLARLGLEG